MFTLILAVLMIRGTEVRDLADTPAIRGKGWRPAEVVSTTNTVIVDRTTTEPHKTILGYERAYLALGQPWASRGVDLQHGDTQQNGGILLNIAITAALSGDTNTATRAQAAIGAISAAHDALSTIYQQAGYPSDLWWQAAESMTNTTISTEYRPVP